jgi:IS30 family transposase
MGDERRNNGRTPIRRWTLDERIRLKKLLDLKIPMKGIEKELDRFSGSICIELKRGGGKENYDPKVEQDYADTEHLRRSRAAEKNPHPPPFTQWINEKIDGLSMQIDILIDIIRNKNKK